MLAMHGRREMKGRVTGVLGASSQGTAEKDSLCASTFLVVSFPLLGPTQCISPHSGDPGAASSPGIGSFLTFPTRASRRAGVVWQGAVAQVQLAPRPQTAGLTWGRRLLEKRTDRRAGKC